MKMNLKHKVTVGAAALLALLFLTACGGETIRVFNWGLFLDPELKEAFRRETGIRVVETTFSSNEDMFAVVSRDLSEFDLIVPSDYMVERMIGYGYLAPINFDNIPNLRNIDPRFLNLAFDPQQRYSVPYKWGTLGILYNPAMVAQSPTDWSILWDPAYANNIFMYDSKRDTFAVALGKLGYSINTTDRGQLERARDLLIEQVPLVRAYLGDEVILYMATGEAALAVMFSGCAWWSIRVSEDYDLNFVIPEGSNLWVNTMVIPRDARNQTGAEKFINFLLDPENARQNTLEIGYSTPVAPAMAKMPENWLQSHIFNPSDALVAQLNLEVFRHLDIETTQLYNSLFTEVMAAFHRR